MIITIDGPTASGKSTIARMLASTLSFFYINSGLLFRAIAYYLKQKNVNAKYLNQITDKDIKNLFESKYISYVYLDNRVSILFENKDITDLLKDASIDELASIISKNILVRKAIEDYQHILADNYNIVADGRDCGTIVFPNAGHKFFLTAAIETRAARWQQDQLKRGNIFSLDESLQVISQRDNRDSTRKIAPLVPAIDANIIDNSDLTIEETLQIIIDIIK